DAKPRFRSSVPNFSSSRIMGLYGSVEPINYSMAVEGVFIQMREDRYSTDKYTLFFYIPSDKRDQGENITG
ncbi:hypothetical protein, partial [Methanocalculus sp.]|uniref:hypothetical protein n=1 Tax=Methanocalculus sp. TaxID=2004547 RepID=UPI0025FB0903